MKIPIRHGMFVCIVVVIACCRVHVCLAENGFQEEADARGVNYTTNQSSIFYGAGMVFADLDDDGDPDIVTVGRNDNSVGLFVNNGAGGFVGSTIPGVTVTNAGGVTAADYDGDRDLDLYFANVGVPNILLRNDGGMTFTDVTAMAGVGDGGAGHGCCWGDYDRDGWLDLYLGNRTNLSDPEPNRLYHNNGDGTFSDVAAALGVDRGDDPTFQASFFDFNRDGWPDLYLCTDKGEFGCNPFRNHLYRNMGGSFVEITDSSGMQACIACMGMSIADIDHDLSPDVYCSNVPIGNVLFMNQDDETFAETAIEAGVGSHAMGWGVEFLDFDNDGYQEIYVCNSTDYNRLYDWAGTAPFVDIARPAGAALGEPSYCVATADMENDGDIDILVQSSFRPIRLFVNHSNVGNWIRFRLMGDGPNTRGVGARVRVETPSLTQEQEVRVGSGFKSCSSYDPHFGLGAATSVTRVTVYWPDDRISIVENPAINSVVSIGQAMATLPCDGGADVNRDGVIDGADIQVFVSLLMAPATACDGDLNRDGVADVLDVGMLVDCLLADACAP